MSKVISFPSPAKLNLFLHVVGQRADGYHELETLFQFLDYGDTIDITVTNNVQITLLTPIKGVSNDDNLIVKAARLLQQTSGCSLGAKISINKILPMGGGLGGGSSNAATVLLALNTLWRTHLSTDELAKIGLSLGADVPIFIHGFSAFAQGVGEQLTPMNPPECWYLVTKPPCSISTASVFSSTDLPRNTPRQLFKYDTALNSTLTSTISIEQNDIDNCHNDCQIMVTKHYPEVAKLLAWLVEYAPSRMTGTGACVFSRFASKKAAIEVQKKLPSEVSSFVTQGLNQSPLISSIVSLKESF